MKPVVRREVAGHLQKAYGISERRACSATGFQRSSQRYRKRWHPCVSSGYERLGLVDGPLRLDQQVKAAPRLRREGDAVDILDHCCAAWNKLINQPWTIMSIGLREWVHQ